MHRPSMTFIPISESNWTGSSRSENARGKYSKLTNFTQLTCERYLIAPLLLYHSIESAAYSYALSVRKQSQDKSVLLK